MPSGESAARALLLAEALTAFTVLTVVLRVAAPWSLRRALDFVRGRRFLLPASVAILAAFAGVLAVNVAFPGFLDHAEPGIISVSWLLRGGAPLYHPVDHVDRYTLLYGPTCYLPYAFALWMSGGSLVAVKLVVFAAGLATAGLAYLMFRKQLEAVHAVIATALLLVLMHMLRPNHYFFQVRGDAIILSATALALFGATRTSGMLGVIALASGGAILLDSKVSGFAYLAPLLAISIELRGFTTAISAGGLALLLAVVPFLHPNISFDSYRQWLATATAHPSTANDILATLKAYPVFLAPLPLLVGFAPWRDARLVAYARRKRLLIGTIVAGLAVTTMISGRIGAGSHHVMPFMFVLAYEYAALYRLTRATSSQGERTSVPPGLDRAYVVGYVWCCVALVALIRVYGGLVQVLEPWSTWSWASDVTRDLEAVLGRYPTKVVQMGYGRAEEPLNFFRTNVVFHSGRELLDAQALYDMDLDGIPIPRATIEAVASCAADIWLVPKGQDPFSLTNVFADLYPLLIERRPIFGLEFREAFFGSHVKAESTGYFDVWKCHGLRTGLR